MDQVAILKAFSDIPDARRTQGKRHSVALCLAIFTLAVAAGNQGFLAIGDWIDSYRAALRELFQVERLPSYSTIRRVLLKQDYPEYSARLASFFGVSPKAGETVAVDGKVLRGSYMVEDDNPYQDPHPAIRLCCKNLLRTENSEDAGINYAITPKIWLMKRTRSLTAAFATP